MDGALGAIRAGGVEIALHAVVSVRIAPQLRLEARQLRTPQPEPSVKRLLLRRHERNRRRHRQHHAHPRLVRLAQPA